MKGYWEDPEATARVLWPGPYPWEQVLHTGDLFRMDNEGFLYFVGRKDDLIKSRREKVSPKEVENVLYALPGAREAENLRLPEEIRQRPPPTDTYSLPQTQEEFYFSLPYDKLDVCLYAFNHGIPATEAGPAAGLTARQVELAYRDLADKRRATRYLHERPLLVEPMPELDPDRLTAAE